MNKSYVLKCWQIMTTDTYTKGLLVTSYTGTTSSNKQVLLNTIWRIGGHDGGLIHVIVTGLTIENGEEIVKVKELNPRKVSLIHPKYSKQIFLRFFHHVC